MRETLCWSERTQCSNLQPTASNSPNSPSNPIPTHPTLPPSLGPSQARPSPNLSLTFSWTQIRPWTPCHDNRSPTSPPPEASANCAYIIRTAEQQKPCLVHYFAERACCRPSGRVITRRGVFCSGATCHGGPRSRLGLPHGPFPPRRGGEFVKRVIFLIKRIQP